ncbi:mammalian cell entry protein [Rhodococcus kronopolitis]|uniref:Mammalian cell entry protein n=1 Tax=Rhodococcus kronopolitis TaxID=1460226 RepID=A0ABV9FWT2_9NOCA
MGQTQGQAEPDRAAAPGHHGGRVRVIVTALLVLTCLVLASLSGVMLWQHHSATQRQAEREEILRAARDGAIAVSTVDHAHAEDDVQRVLAASTGQFRDDFEERSQGYLEVVKRAQVSTTGQEAEAGIESQDGDTSTVLVQLTSKVSNSAGAQDQARTLRLRVTMEKVGDRFKMSGLEFVA